MNTQHNVIPERDNETDTLLSNIFFNLLCQIKERHDQLVELAVMINIPDNDQRFFSWTINP